MRFNGTLHFFIPVIFLLIGLNAEAQRYADPGFFAGTSYYMGDLHMYAPFQDPSVAFGPILRYNFNPRHSLRGHIIYNELRSFNTYFLGTNADFQASFVDLGLNFEFNWLPYKTAFRKTKYTPYVTGGVAYNLMVNGRSESHLNIPFGIGVKVNLGNRLSGGIEHTVRKTFTDGIDGTYNVDVNVPEKPLILGNSDWVMFTGIFLTYKIFKYNEECPAYEEEPKPRRL
ncbi:MAG: outer membrane beta-barrel protein [Bacteroidales bacterium]|nr:outer membrane beta-barrel protein [Bacteroidales bacterium]MBN2697309.1 outer membrane beta-barrel protein [Bacteroidales bacterium]